MDICIVFSLCSRDFLNISVMGLFQFSTQMNFNKSHPPQVTACEGKEVPADLDGPFIPGVL